MLVTSRMLIVEPHHSALFSKRCLLLVPKNKRFFLSVSALAEVVSLLLGKMGPVDATITVLGEAGEEPKLPSWKCLSLLILKPLPFCLASPL